MKKIGYLLTAVTLIIILAACSGNSEEVVSDAAVNGNISYLQRIALPDNAVVNITIQNASIADAPPEVSVISATSIESPGQVPIPFSTLYSPEDVDSNSTYLLYVRIEDSSGNLLFLNTNGTPVLTHGSPTENVEVIVEQVGGTAEVPAPTDVPPTLASLNGNVINDETITLPEGATANIMIQNASIADAPPEESLLGQQIINNPGQFPIPFSVTYDAAAVEEQMSYVLFARIEDAEGTLLFLNTQGQSVLTQGNPTDNVDVLVEEITPITPPETPTELPSPEPTADPNTGTNPNSPTAPAAGLTFRLVSFGPPGYEREIIPGTEITALFTADQISGSAGCNGYSGNVIPLNDYFVFGPLVATAMACAEPEGIMEQERDYLASLQGTAGYQYQYQADGSSVVVGLQLLYPLADGGNGVLTYVTTP
ncbi:MAG: META domain-containing protein [Chloroflexi bacterium]|nr:META domain-containing protein [Chloroflexota bacterium]